MITDEEIEFLKKVLHQSVVNNIYLPAAQLKGLISRLEMAESPAGGWPDEVAEKLKELIDARIRENIPDTEVKGIIRGASLLLTVLYKKWIKERQRLDALYVVYERGWRLSFNSGVYSLSADEQKAEGLNVRELLDNVAKELKIP